MPDTFVKIASVTVGSGGASSIDFTSIPSTYTDLVVKISGRSSQSGTTQDYGSLRFNSSTSGYSNREVFGNGSSASSSSTSSQDQLYFTWVYPGASATASTFGSVDIYIPNYAGSNYKSVSLDGTPENNTSGITYTTLTAGLWANTSAITSISLRMSNLDHNFVQYSTATLYGIKNS